MAKAKGKKAKSKEAPVQENANEGRKIDRQVIILLAAIIFVFALMFAFIYVYNHASDFKYNGLKFTKTNMNGLILYETHLQLTRPDGVFRYPLQLRNDPRELSKIETNVPAMLLRRGSFVSISPELSPCYGSNLGPFELGSILGALGIRAKGATTSEEVALQNNLTKIDCQDDYDGTIIVMQEAEMDSVMQNGDCYTLNISQCRITEVTERFILEMVSQLVEQGKNKLLENTSNSS